MATEIDEKTKQEIRDLDNGALALIVLKELTTTGEMLAGGEGQFAYNELQQQTGWRLKRE